MSESTNPPVYERFVRELAVLECVRATLSEWEHAGMPAGTECKVSSAELALSRSIARMYDLLSDIANVEMVSEMALDHMEADVRNAQEVATIEGNRQRASMSDSQKVPRPITPRCRRGDMGDSQESDPCPAASSL
jgi:hypothetical protein